MKHGNAKIVANMVILKVVKTFTFGAHIIVATWKLWHSSKISCEIFLKIFFLSDEHLDLGWDKIDPHNNSSDVFKINLKRKMNVLPLEIIIVITSFLRIIDLVNFTSSCKTIKALSEIIFKKRYKKYFQKSCNLQCRKKFILELTSRLRTSMKFYKGRVFKSLCQGESFTLSERNRFIEGSFYVKYLVINMCNVDSKFFRKNSINHLKVLKISDSIVIEFPKEMFSSRVSLKTLEFNNIQLPSFTDSFKNLTNLESLRLSRSCFRIVPDYIFSYRLLEWLNLSWNAIFELPEEIIHLTSLKYLNLSKNYLKKLPRLPESLISLNVIENKLTNFPEVPVSLTTLYIEKNMIQGEPPEWTKKLKDFSF